MVCNYHDLSWRFIILKAKKDTKAEISYGFKSYIRALIPLVFNLKEIDRRITNPTTDWHTHIYLSYIIIIPCLMVTFQQRVLFLVSSENCSRLSWSTGAMMISSISSSRFCSQSVLTIWNLYGSRLEWRPSQKKELCSQLAKGLLISANLAAPCLIDTLYSALVLKSDWVWRIIWDTELSRVARSEASYCLFKVLHLSFGSSTPLIL